MVRSTGVGAVARSCNSCTRRRRNARRFYIAHIADITRCRAQAAEIAVALSRAEGFRLRAQVAPSSVGAASSVMQRLLDEADVDTESVCGKLMCIAQLARCGPRRVAVGAHGWWRCGGSARAGPFLVTVAGIFTGGFNFC